MVGTARTMTAGVSDSSMDAALFAAIAAGDLAAFAQLVSCHQALVCAIAFSAVGDRRIYSRDVDSVAAGGQQQTRTDRGGRFHLSGIAVGSVTAMADSLAFGRSPSIEVESDSAELELIVEPTARVSGRFTRDGQPVSLASVIATAGTGASFRTNTDASGHYEFYRLGAGTYSLGSERDRGGIDPAGPDLVVAPGIDQLRDIKCETSSLPAQATSRCVFSTSTSAKEP